jgi:hypothetical protein
MSKARRLVIAALIAIGAMTAAAPVAAPAAVASVSWGTRPAVTQQHAVVADTWTKRSAARDTWV